MERRELIALTSLSVISIGGFSLIEIELDVENPSGEESTGSNSEETDSSTTNSDPTSSYNLEELAEKDELEREYYEVHIGEYETILDISAEWENSGIEELIQWGDEVNHITFENMAGDPQLGLAGVVIVETDTEVRLDYPQNDPDFYLGHLISYKGEVLSANVFESKKNYQEAVRIAEEHKE